LEDAIRVKDSIRNQERRSLSFTELTAAGVNAHVIEAAVGDPGNRVLGQVLVIAELKSHHRIVGVEPDDQVTSR
jgi:hypothetical protein